MYDQIRNFRFTDSGINRSAAGKMLISSLQGWEGIAGQDVVADTVSPGPCTSSPSLTSQHQFLLHVHS